MTAEVRQALDVLADDSTIQPLPSSPSAEELQRLQLADVRAVELLTRGYEAESTLEMPLARRTLAGTLAGEVVRRRRLIARSFGDQLTAIESRALSGMSSNIKRMMADLGLMAKKKKTSGFFGGDARA